MLTRSLDECNNHFRTHQFNCYMLVIVEVLSCNKQYKIYKIQILYIYLYVIILYIYIYIFYLYLFHYRANLNEWHSHSVLC